MQTRWLALCNALVVFLRIYGAVANFLRSEAAGTGRMAAKAGHILESMMDFKILLGFRVVYFLLTELRQLSRTLLTRDLSVPAAFDAVQEASARIREEYNGSDSMKFNSQLWIKIKSVKETRVECDVHSPLFWAAAEGEPRSPARRTVL